MDPFEFIIAIVATAGTFVTIWVVLLYRRREKKMTPDSEAAYSLHDLSSMAQSMEERIDTLESILDAEVPGWRDQHDHR
ncbi:MAG: envelope stress response membrane protein PspB [Pseudohongiellaceae bacterium]